MSTRSWKSWWMSPVPFAAINGLIVAAAMVGLISVAPPINNTMREEPSAPEFARWTTCAAASAELSTQAMRVPGGVLLRTTDARGADTVLVPIRSYREAERFLAELGCRLTGPASAGKEPT
jgi:hypothetical protein